MYYLQSRYYDPVVGRFISPDDPAYIGANGDFISYNLYAYCSNNPVMGYDPQGTFDWKTCLSGVSLVSVGVGAIVAGGAILACASAPGLMVAIAVVTVAAGVLTVVNGTAEIIESVTGDNFVRDGIMNGNAEAYDTYKTITQIVASVGTAICASYYAYNGGNVCFVAGTMIAAATGQIAIEIIEVGDYVWALDTETGEKALKPVVNVFVNEASELVHVFTANDEIICTNEHPFYSPVKGWVSACQLRAGDILVLLNGEYIIVEWVQHEILESPVKVYNFEVEDFHTYFVGDDGILVHNDCGEKQTSLSQMQKQIERNQAPNSIVRIDNPKIDGQSPHIHFKDGTALNMDGTVHDAMNGKHILTNKERNWLFSNGWEFNLP